MSQDSPESRDHNSPVVAEVLSAPGRLSGLIEWGIRHRGVLLALGLLSMLAAAVPASQLQLDESIESFYAPTDPHLKDYLDSKRWFGGDEFALIAFDNPEVFQKEALEKLAEFAAELGAVPGVRTESTQDMAGTLRRFEEVVSKYVGRNFIARKISTLFRADLIDFSQRVLISDDHRTSAIVLRLLPESEAPVPRKETLRAIRRIAAAHQPPAYVSGEPVMVHDMFRYVEQDGAVLGWASSALLILVILVLFRSLRWMILPLLVVHAALLWTKALLVLSGMKLSMVSSILTSLITIIGIATVTHVTIRFRDLRRTLDRQAAFRQTMLDLAPPIWWTCATTTMGFAALLSSGIVPVRSFGLMVATGTMLVLLACVVLLPGGVLIGQWDADPRDAPAERRVLAGLARVTDWVEHQSRLLLTVLVVLIALSVGGLFRLRVETDFSKNFRESSPVLASIRYFEEQLGGVGTWEVNFRAPAEAESPEIEDETASNSDDRPAPSPLAALFSGGGGASSPESGLNPEYLDTVAQAATALRQVRMSDGTGLSKAVAFSDGIDFIPGIAASSLDQQRDILRQLQPEFETSLYDPREGRMRIMLRAYEQQPAETKLQLIGEVERTAREAFPDARATGLYVLLSHLITSLLSDQLTSFGIASLGILVMMTIAYRSFGVGIISLFPNVFPILLVIGGMGWFAVPINIGTAMIASVSMGLTVDSSIHYLSGYRRARASGMPHFAAIRATHADVGRALIFANVALVLGFTVLALSNFIPLIYFGVLVSLSMLGGLLGNLVLLPLLLYWVPVPVPVSRRHPLP
jgi:hypothetical protein